MGKIKFDFITVTSKHSGLRSFAFFLLRKSNRLFTLRVYRRHMGGFFYKGVVVKVGGSDSNGFFIGQRKSSNCYNFIITIPGEISNQFASSFLKNSNLLNRIWRITRLDLQLTCDYDFKNESQVIFLYWFFFLAQKALEKKKLGRNVGFVFNEFFALVSVSFSKTMRRNSWKVYTSMTKKQISQGLGVRFEVTVKNSLEYLDALKKIEGDIEKCNFKIIQQTLKEAAKTDLLAKHRCIVRDWRTYNKAQDGPETSFLERGRRPTEFGPKEPRRPPIDGRRPRRKRQSRLSEELTLVAQALQSFAEMVKSKRPTFSHKQVKFLNEQLNPRNWRVSWNIRKEWAIIPTQSHHLWAPLFNPLPSKARRQAIEKRRDALKYLASKINAIVRNCEKLSPRKRDYVEEPKANKIVREIMEIVVNYSVMDKDAGGLPRAEALYSENFDEKPDYVQEIIKTRQREKYAKMMRKLNEDFKRETTGFD